MRLAPGQHRVTGWIRNGVAMQLVACASIKFEIARTCGNVGARLLSGLAAVLRFQRGQLVEMIQYGLRKLG